MVWRPDGLCTGVGSLSSHDPLVAVDWIFREFEQLPWWPQLPKKASMIPTWIGRIPGARSHEGRCTLPWDSPAVSAGLQRHFRSRRRPDPLHAEPAYKIFLEHIESHHFFKGQYFKGQAFGPLSLCGVMSDRRGGALPYSRENLEVLSEFVVDVCLAQARDIQFRGGDALIVIDEPLINAADPYAIGILKDLAHFLRDKMYIGLHCCGTAPWGQITKLGFGYLNLDVFTYLEQVIPHRHEFIDYVENGGILALGIVPTFPPNAQLDPQVLHGKLLQVLKELFGDLSGSRELRQSLILTPSCGTAGHTHERQRKIYHVLQELGRLL